MDVENRKFSTFLENLKTVDLRNELEQKNGGSAVHGITKFSDLSQDEFAAHYLTADEKLKSAPEGINNFIFSFIFEYYTYVYFVW